MSDAAVDLTHRATKSNKNLKSQISEIKSHQPNKNLSLTHSVHPSASVPLTVPLHLRARVCACVRVCVRVCARGINQKRPLPTPSLTHCHALWLPSSFLPFFLYFLSFTFILSFTFVRSFTFFRSFVPSFLPSFLRSFCCLFVAHCGRCCLLCHTIVRSFVRA